MIPLLGGGPPDSDDREVTLALDINALEVHHVRAISFKIETHKVSRQRLEKH